MISFLIKNLMIKKMLKNPIFQSLNKLMTHGWI